MANNIERLNYYEREYLRSFDFIAEQNYHLEMRRRLNLALHLWGIVEGLDVKKGEIVQGAPDQYYISPGMAIDAYGREIFLFAPYVLSEDDVQCNRITVPDRYSLFIAYTTDLTTPPSPGFAVCDLPDQYTRRHEAYQIIISNDLDDSVDPKKAKIPLAVDEISDDPVKQPWPVRLGSVDVGADLTITNAFPKNRTYIGVRAQRIIAPVASLGDTAPDANRPISVEADLRARKNTIIGKDFTVDKTKTFPAPPATINPFPSKKGNIKIRHDLFLRGDFYKKVDDNWLNLAEYLKTITPEILAGTKDFTIDDNITVDPKSKTVSFEVPTQLIKNVKNAPLIAASISSVRWNTTPIVQTILGTGGIGAILFEVRNASATKGSTDNSVKIEFTYEVGPTVDDSGGGTPNFRTPIIGLTVAYVVVCYPVT